MNFPSPLKDWLEACLGFIYPNVCQICDDKHATASEGFVCSLCWENVRFIKPPFCERCGLPYAGDITTDFECHNCREAELHFRSARSAVVASGLVRDIIHRYKYNHATWFEPFLADLLIRQAAPVLPREKWDMIVPVPLHPTKLREREFNQAERLAIRLSEATGIRVNKKLLRRIAPTLTQTRLSRQERLTNVAQAFDLCRGKTLNGENIVVLDDVFTTGATTSACAKVLKSAGAGDICVWTVARGL
jgi:ComF family protein